ncbi:LysR family transcriptional regulator [Streptomyces sp. NPDC047841]|uniref:LysR family transcriptional regulator n=1 Tax=Streptomyces sp. NPDC047841 TaxID=3154708 RepID=UPI0034560CAD
MSLRRLDLNLLLSLEALLEERSVTRAARRMGLAQPTLSSSLARLRRHFADALLVRAGNEYRLTPLAARLRDRVRVAVIEVDRVFQTNSSYDPATSTREFRLLVSDYALAVLGPAITDMLAQEAPRSRLRMSPISSTTADLPEQAVLGHDLLFMPHGFVVDLPHQDLFEDRWMCLVAEENPLVGEELTVEHLCALPWVASYLGPTASTPAVRQMRMLGIEPRIQFVTDSFLAVPGLIAGSQRVALIQERLLHGTIPLAGLRVLPCPFPAGPLVEAMWWHPVSDDDPEHVYLRSVVERACSALPGC